MQVHGPPSASRPDGMPRARRLGLSKIRGLRNPMGENRENSAFGNIGPAMYSVIWVQLCDHCARQLSFAQP